MSKQATAAAPAPPVPELPALDVIHHRNFLEGALTLPDNSVDLAIIDPPYNASKGGAWSWNAAAGLPGFGGDWRKVSQVWDDMPLPDYFAFTLSWLTDSVPCPLY